MDRLYWSRGLERRLFFGPDYRQNHACMCVSHPGKLKQLSSVCFSLFQAHGKLGHYQRCTADQNKGNSTMSDAQHIAILDDDPEIRSLLEQNLRSASFEVSTASNGRDLKTILEHQTIDLIVLDLMLPGEDGLTICRELRADSNIPIIMLTAMTHEADRIIGLEMGADDYLTKPFSPRELVARIKATLRRQGMVTTQSEDRRRTAIFEGWKLDVVRRELRDPDDVLVDLTSGEFDLLAALIERPNRLMTRDLLLDITKGRQADVFDRSIDITISRLRQKIEEDPKNPQFIKTVRGKGYIFSAEIS